MSSQTELEGFTPLYGQLAKKWGLVPAAVYGFVHRCCQMSGKACFATLETIAENVGMNRRTALRHLKELCNQGYLEDQTPDKRNAPHTYVTTDKIEVILRIEAEVKGVTESHSGVTDSHSAVTESPSESDTKSLEETKKRQSKRQSKREGETPPPSPPPEKSKRPIAVETFRQAVHRYPAKSWWQKIDKAVGRDESSLGRWYSVCHSWVGMGWNPTNVKGMLEYFERGEIPGSKGKATPRRPIVRVPNQEEIDAWWATEDELTETLGRPPSSDEIKAHLEGKDAVRAAKGRI